MTLKSKHEINFNESLISIVTENGLVPFTTIEKKQYWSYDTKSEKITLTTTPTQPETLSLDELKFETDNLSLSKDEAMRALELLMNWAETCNGIGTVEKILKK